MYNNCVSKPNEEVKIISGVFKGIYGYPEQIEMSDSEATKIHIRVDSDNVIKVNLHEVEFLYEDYLIYKRDCIRDKVIEVYGKQRLRKDKVESYLISKSLSDCKNSTYSHNIYAIPLNKVEFKFEDKSLSLEEVKKIIG